MSKLATTKMSSKGQVVIPEEVRSRLGLEPGEQFIVVGDKDVVTLKKITPPSMRDFDSLVARARKQARVAGMKPSDRRRCLYRLCSCIRRKFHRQW
jgi:AbrB family looped-hinge helix DNA binding protein